MPASSTIFRPERGPMRENRYQRRGAWLNRAPAALATVRGVGQLGAMMDQDARRAFVETHRTCIFGYQRKQGPPSMSVVYYVMVADDLLISTMATRAKARAVARTRESASPVSRTIGNFFLGLHRAPYPTRLFSSEREALGWLHDHRRAS